MQRLAALAFIVAIGAALSATTAADAGSRCGPHAHWVRGHYVHRHWVPGHCV